MVANFLNTATTTRTHGTNALSLQVKEDKPDLAFGDVGKEIGDRWKSINDKDKAKFEEMAKKDKDRYTKEKAAYDAKGGAPADDDEDDE